MSVQEDHDHCDTYRVGSWHGLEKMASFPHAVGVVRTIVLMNLGFLTTRGHVHRGLVRRVHAVLKPFWASDRLFGISLARKHGVIEKRPLLADISLLGDLSPGLALVDAKFRRSHIPLELLSLSIKHDLQLVVVVIIIARPALVPVSSRAALLSLSSGSVERAALQQRSGPQEAACLRWARSPRFSEASVEWTHACLIILFHLIFRLCRNRFSRRYDTKSLLQQQQQ